MWSYSILPFLFATALGQQGILGSSHNVTSLTGTWSTGSGAVVTGPPHVNPNTMSVQYPKNTGRSFSFIDGPVQNHWEQFEYRITANASNPNCITAVITWQHGSYEYLSNGSLALQPFEGDGFQQIEGPCLAISSQVVRYNQHILFSQWQILTVSSSPSAVQLMLFEFDGTPVAPMNLLANPPNMLPTQTIIASQSSPSTKSKRNIEQRNSASRAMYMAGGIGAMTVLGAVLVLL